MKEFNHLVLVRHGQSEWNAKNLFTGWKDPDLTKLGIDEAKKGGELLIEKQILSLIHISEPTRLV